MILLIVLGQTRCDDTKMSDMMNVPNSTSSIVVLIIGGGPAGVAAASSLRKVSLVLCIKRECVCVSVSVLCG